MAQIIIKDGIRGIANSALTAELAFRAGRAFASVLLKSFPEGLRILVGNDTRASCDMLKAALSAGICSVGVSVINVSIIPTPALSFLVKKYKTHAAVMIGGGDASFEHNGISFFDADGKRMDDTFSEEILKLANGEEELTSAEPQKLGRIKRTHTALRDYADYVKTFKEKTLDGVRLAIDAANGSAYECAKLIFSEVGADVEMINNRPDGININADCGTTSTANLSQYVITHNRNFGIAFSGDGDNFKIIGNDGQIIHTVCEGDALVCALKAVCALV